MKKQFDRIVDKMVQDEVDVDEFDKVHEKMKSERNSKQEEKEATEMIQQPFEPSRLSTLQNSDSDDALMDNLPPIKGRGRGRGSRGGRGRGTASKKKVVQESDPEDDEMDIDPPVAASSSTRGRGRGRGGRGRGSATKKQPVVSSTPVSTNSRSGSRNSSIQSAFQRQSQISSISQRSGANVMYESDSD